MYCSQTCQDLKKGRTVSLDHSDGRPAGRLPVKIFLNLLKRELGTYRANGALTTVPNKKIFNKQPLTSAETYPFS
jgi:hypothetical protein